jgi:hypothetical protein
MKRKGKKTSDYAVWWPEAYYRLLFIVIFQSTATGICLKKLFDTCKITSNAF